MTATEPGAQADTVWGDHTPTGPCYLCGDPRDHDGQPHGEVTGDYLVRTDVNACTSGDFGCTLGEGHQGPHIMPAQQCTSPVGIGEPPLPRCALEDGHDGRCEA